MVSKINKLIFLLPPKTGSTSIARCLKVSMLPLSDIVNYNQYPTVHLTLNEIIDLYSINFDELNEYKIIQIVRNPYDRFISSITHQNKLLSTNYDVMHYLQKLKQYLYLLPNDFDMFYEKFYGTIKYKQNVFQQNNWGGLRFWFKQEWWSNSFKNIHYLKLENISNDLDILSNCIGFKLNKLPHIRPANGERDLDYRSYFNNESKKIFDDLYESDLKLFNYEF